MDIFMDFNADLGEGFGAYSYGADEELLPLVTSANIACGWHGGDPSVIRRAAKRRAAASWAAAWGSRAARPGSILRTLPAAGKSSAARRCAFMTRNAARFCAPGIDCAL